MKVISQGAPHKVTPSGAMFMGYIISRRLDGRKRFCLFGWLNIIPSFVKSSSVEYICPAGATQSIIIKGILFPLSSCGKAMFCCTCSVTSKPVLVMLSGLKIRPITQLSKVWFFKSFSVSNLPSKAYPRLL